MSNSKDSLSRVQSGEPLRIPAEAWNRAMEATETVEALTLSKRRHRIGGASVPVMRCYNASGETAPHRGVVEISNTTNTTEFVEFVRPGNANGVGVYGILLEPVPAGMAGCVAVAGGPWELSCAEDAIPGNIVGAEADGWTAVLEGLPAFEVLRAPVGGVVLARFLGGMSIEIRDDDPPQEELWEGRMWFNRNAWNG